MDLLRNDLSRACRLPGVRVEAFPELESYANVHHLVATVSGELRPGLDLRALFAALFPGGSVTGSDILYHEISRFKEKTGAKVVAAMMDIAASGGYYVALPADRIWAHPTTVTGSVGSHPKTRCWNSRELWKQRATCGAR